MGWRRGAAAVIAVCAALSSCSGPPGAQSVTSPTTSPAAASAVTPVTPVTPVTSAVTPVTHADSSVPVAAAPASPSSPWATVEYDAAPGQSISGTAAASPPVASAPTERTATAASGSGSAGGPASLPRSVTILGSGDVLLHPPLWAQAKADAVETGYGTYDFGPIFAGAARAVAAADVAICELETPVSGPRGPFSAWPRFDVPPQVLGTLRRIGYDSCTTASNHTLDQGVDGVTRTLDAMDAVGLKHTGSARSAAEASRPLIITTDSGVRVGQLAYTFGFNGLQRPAGRAWIANLIDVPEILAAARRTKAAGADIVVLSLHWGTEYDHLATATQRRLAAQLLASPDIDLILGDHAHAVQPMQRLNGEWVVYGMGNQVARHANPIDTGREGIMPVITFTERRDGTFRATSARIVPTWMQLTPEARLIDLAAASVDPRLPASLRAQYRATVTRIRGYVDAYGEKVPVADAVASAPPGG